MNIKKLFKSIFLLYLSTILFLTGCDNIESVVSTTSSYTSTSSTATVLTAQSTLNTQATSVSADITQKKRIALTFDDGPHNIYTKNIIDELAKYGYHATFFVVGNRVDGSAYRGGSMVTYALQNGHEVGIHGYTHNVHYDTCSDEEYAYELNKTSEAISKFSFDYETKLMRPIGGSISAERVASCNYSVITWNVDSEDWKNKYLSEDTIEEQQEKVARIVENVMSSVDDGSIVLMHDIYESTYDAVKILLERLYEEGYEVVTVSELIGEPIPGTKYSENTNP